jgi:hypothetical protein
MSGLLLSALSFVDKKYVLIDVVTIVGISAAGLIPNILPEIFSKWNPSFIHLEFGIRGDYLLSYSFLVMRRNRLLTFLLSSKDAADGVGDAV